MPTRIKHRPLQPAHAGSPVWVHVAGLHEYPSEPIQEPSMKGGA